MRAVSFYVPNSTTAEELIIQRIIDAGNIRNKNIMGAIESWYYEYGQQIDSEDGSELYEAFKADYIGTYLNDRDFAMDYISQNGLPENIEDFIDYDKLALSLLSSHAFNDGKHYFYNR